MNRKDGKILSVKIVEMQLSVQGTEFKTLFSSPFFGRGEIKPYLQVGNSDEALITAVTRTAPAERETEKTALP